MTEFSIQPTMVFVDADHRYEGVKQDLDALSRLLSPGVPVLCHDYSNPENDTGEYGVRRAATEWEESGHAEFLGTFGCAALFVTTARCGGLVPRMMATTISPRARLLCGYGVCRRRPSPRGRPTGARAVALEQELEGCGLEGLSGRTLARPSHPACGADHRRRGTAGSRANGTGQRRIGWRS
jgi:hypothetical protein